MACESKAFDSCLVPMFHWDTLSNSFLPLDRTHLSDHDSWQGFLSLWIIYSHMGKSAIPYFASHYTIVSRFHSFNSN